MATCASRPCRVFACSICFVFAFWPAGCLACCRFGLLHCAFGQLHYCFVPFCVFACSICGFWDAAFFFFLAFEQLHSRYEPFCPFCPAACFAVMPSWFLHLCVGACWPCCRFVGFACEERREVGENFLGAFIIHRPYGANPLK